MRRLAMSTRRWILAVALSALLMSAFVFERQAERLSVDYRGRAARYALQEEWSRISEAGAEDLVHSYESAARAEEEGPGRPGEPQSRHARSLRAAALRSAADAMRGEASRSAEQVAFFAALRTKYERASGKPWMPLRPDPPVPSYFRASPDEPPPRSVIVDWPEGLEDEPDAS